jgi:hypothetical protein
MMLRRSPSLAPTLLKLHFVSSAIELWLLQDEQHRGERTDERSGIKCILATDTLVRCIVCLRVVASMHG